MFRSISGSVFLAFFSIFVILFSIAEIFGLFQTGQQNRRDLILISQLLFFNVIHVGFTYSFLFASDRGKLWIESVWRISIVKAFFVLFVLFALMAAAIGGMIYQGLLTLTPQLGFSWFLVFQLLLIVVLPAQHRIGQSFGLLSGQLHSKLSFSRYGGFRLCRRAFVAVSVIALTLSFVVRYYFEWDLFYLRVLFALTLLSLAFYIFYLESKFYPLKERISLRLFLWPLAIFSDLAVFGLIALHGMEYFGVYIRLVGLQSSRTHWVSLGLGVFLIVAFFVRPFGGAGIGFNPESYYGGIALLSGISYSLSLLHFGLDQRIFKMKDPKVQAVLKDVI